MKSIIWALFGNDEDSIYGPAWFNNGQHSKWIAIKWWIRNPFHNLLWHVLNWPGGPFFKWGHSPGWNGYIGFRPPNGVFGIALKHET